MSNKPTFKNHEKPLKCCMIQAYTPEAALATIKKANAEGCDAFGYQHCKMRAEYDDEKTIRTIFEAMEGKPIYVTNYRHHSNDGKTDEEICEGLARLIGFGATMCDVMGDMFCRTPGELTMDAEAIEKQRRFIERIHEMGGEVLMSSHIQKYTESDEVLRIAKEHHSRGADVAKIVTGASSAEEERENLRITLRLKQELEKPFLFLSGGSHNRLHRMLGPTMGVVMWLCVQEHDELSTKSQPLVSDIKALESLLRL